MKVLLDIDGVMVRQKPWKTEPLEDDGFPAFTNGSIEAFNKFFSGADIVLNTSHRFSFSIIEWEQIFKSRGINFNTIDITGPGERIERTTKWIETNEDFVVIDDSSQLSFLGDRLIKPSPLIGLTNQIIEEWITTTNVSDSRGSS